MTAVLAVTALLALTLFSMFWSALKRADRDRERRRSNAAVLAEYKNISIHRRHHIVDGNPKGTNR